MDGGALRLFASGKAWVSISGAQPAGGETGSDRDGRGSATELERRSGALLGAEGGPRAEVEGDAWFVQAPVELQEDGERGGGRGHEAEGASMGDQVGRYSIHTSYSLPVSFEAERAVRRRS